MRGFPFGSWASVSLVLSRRVVEFGRNIVPVLCDDGVLQNLLLGGTVLALPGDGRLVLLFLEFATHFVKFLGLIEGVGLVCLVLSRRWSQLAKSFGELSVSVIDSGLGLYRAPGQASLHEVGDRPLSVQPLTTQYHGHISSNHFTRHYGVATEQDSAFLGNLPGCAGMERGCCGCQGRDGRASGQLERA